MFFMSELANIENADNRWATYSNGEFKEGVSLTVDDELNRWQKYAYGCSEWVAVDSSSTDTDSQTSGSFLTPSYSGFVAVQSRHCSSGSCGQELQCITNSLF